MSDVGLNHQKKKIYTPFSPINFEQNNLQASSDHTDASELDMLVLHNECGLSVVGFSLLCLQMF